MNKKERWLFASALFCGLLPFVVVASSLQMLPEVLEIRVDISEIVNVVTISKYNYLFLGIFSLIPLLLAISARVLKRKNVVVRNFTAMVVSALVIGIAFSLVGVYGVVYQVAVKKVDILRDFDFVGTSAVVLSIIFGFLCNILPDIKPNDFLGIKNKYTLGSTKVWVRVHNDIGELYMGVYFLLSVILSGMATWLNYKYSFIHLAIWAAVTVLLISVSNVYSKNVSIKIKKEEAATAIELNEVVIAG